jgi:hypothetical protein
MFVLIFAGYVPTLGFTQSQANLWYGSQQDSSRERLSIEMMIFNTTNPSPPSPTNKSIDIYVRNVGQIDVKIAAVYVNGSLQPQASVKPVPISLTYPNTPIYVKAGNATNIVQFKITYVWLTNRTYTAKVATARGNSVVSTAIAP